MARTQVIALTRDDETLRQLAAELSECARSASEQVKFMQARAKQVVEEHAKKSQETWRKIEAHAKERGYLPKEFVYDRDTLSMDGADSALSVTIRDGRGGNCNVCGEDHPSDRHGKGGVEVKTVAVDADSLPAGILSFISKLMKD